MINLMVFHRNFVPEVSFLLEFSMINLMLFHRNFVSKIQFRYEFHPFAPEIHRNSDGFTNAFPSKFRLILRPEAHFVYEISYTTPFRIRMEIPYDEISEDEISMDEIWSPTS